MITKDFRLLIFYLRIGAVGCLLISLSCLLVEPVLGWLDLGSQGRVLGKVSKYAGSEELEVRSCELAGRVASRVRGRFQVVVSSPLVVVSDVGETKMLELMRDVIRPVLKGIECSYFPDGVSEPVVIYLCRDTASFRELARQLDGLKPTAYYGYYDREKRHLLVDVSTGMGTLAHELTHILSHDCFSQMAVWLDEGLASLHEECEISPDGKSLIGYKNWRWEVAVRELQSPGFNLQRVLEDRSYVNTSPRAAYAVARALCLYLQQQGKLRDYVAECQCEIDDDPQGVLSLIEVLGKKNLGQVEQEFRVWVNNEIVN